MGRVLKEFFSLELKVKSYTRAFRLLILLKAVGRRLKAKKHYLCSEKITD